VDVGQNGFQFRKNVFGAAAKPAQRIRKKGTCSPANKSGKLTPINLLQTAILRQCTAPESPIPIRRRIVGGKPSASSHYQELTPLLYTPLQQSIAELLSGSRLDGTGGWRPLELSEILNRWEQLNGDPAETEKPLQ